MTRYLTVRSISFMHAALILGVASAPGNAHSARTFTSSAPTSVSQKAEKVQKPSRKITLRGGNMSTRIENGRIVVTGIKGGFAGGQVLVKGRIAPDLPQEQSVDARFSNVSLHQALSFLGKNTLEKFDEIPVTGKVDAKWRGKGLSEIVGTATGTLTLSTGPGVITDPTALDHLEELTGISDLTEVKYEKIQISTHAGDGRLIIDSATVTSPDFKLSVHGEYHATTDQLDLVLDAKLSPDLASKSTLLKLRNVVGFFTKKAEPAPPASDGFVEVPQILISGSLKDPDVSLNKNAKKVAQANQ